jgi:hypothetical protein
MPAGKVVAGNSGSAQRSVLIGGSGTNDKSVHGSCNTSANQETDAIETFHHRFVTRIVT